MWPLFGLLTLVVASVHAGVTRWRGASWTGVPSRVSPRSHRVGEPDPPPIPFQFGVSVRKRKRWHVAVTTGTSLAFECKPESLIDRFFKWCGLVVEHELGVDALDRAVYIVSDDPRVLRALKGDDRVRELLAALFCRRPHPDYEMERLVCRAGQLRLELRESTYLYARVTDMHEKVVPMLRELADRLPRTLPATEGRQDPMNLRAIIALSLSSGLAISGGLHLLRLLLLPGAKTVSPVALVLLSLPVAAALFGLLLFVTTALLARSSRLHLVLLEITLVGGFGAFASGIVAVRDLNISLDQSAPVTLETTVTDRYVSHGGRRGRTRYNLYLAEWPEGGRPRLEVDYATYYAVRPGDRVALTLRDGRFGLRWIGGVRRVDTPPPR